MKTNLKTPAARALKMCARASAAALLLLGSTGMLQAQPSPVGTWDCTISGRNQGGIAFLDFGPSNTLTGFRLLSTLHPTPSSRGTVTVGRGGADVGRGGDSGSGSTVSSSGGSSGNTNLVGFDTFNGSWNFDEKGRVVGKFTEVVGGGLSCTTNVTVSTITGSTVVPQTNGDGTISYFMTNVTFSITNPATVTCVTNPSVTNGVSFIGRAVPSRRLTLVASTSNGKVTYRGVPFVTNLTDLSGDWFATRVVKKQSFLENFTFAPAGDPFLPNIYLASNGTGPDYDLQAIALLSSHKKVGMAFLQGDTNGILSSLVAPLRISKTGVLSFTGRGVELDTRRPGLPSNITAFVCKRQRQWFRRPLARNSDIFS